MEITRSAASPIVFLGKPFFGWHLLSGRLWLVTLSLAPVALQSTPGSAHDSQCVADMPRLLRGVSATALTVSYNEKAEELPFPEDLRDRWRSGSKQRSRLSPV